MLRRLDLEDRLESATEARNKGELSEAVAEAETMGAVVSDLLRKRFDEVLAAAKAMVAKLAAFESCQEAMDTANVEGLHAAIGAAQGGWWKAEFWYESDKQQLKAYQLAYKRLTVLAELQKYMEPLDVGRLQGALDTALQVKMVDPLVDRAAEILANIDRETSSGAFSQPYDCGGAYGGKDWLGNPHFKVSFTDKEGSPDKVRISITCAEGKGGGDDTDYFGAFAVHVVRNADKHRTREAQPGFELIASSEYSMDTAVLCVDDLDTSHAFFLIPSTQVQGEEGPFVLNVICETPGADLVLEPVVQVRRASWASCVPSGRPCQTLCALGTLVRVPLHSSCPSDVLSRAPC